MAAALVGWAMLLVATARGAEPGAYRVELLIFTHGGGSAPGSPAEPIGETQSAVALAQAGDDGFRALARNQIQLATADSILANSSHYQVIKLVGWRQPALDQSQAKAVRIHGGPTYPAPVTTPAKFPPNRDAGNVARQANEQPRRLQQLDGTVKIVAGRYLDVAVDLVFRQPMRTRNLNPGPPYPQTTALRQYRLEQHRRVRSGDLYYLDHPLLGVLIQITPIQQ